MDSRWFILRHLLVLNTNETAHIPQKRGGALVLTRACADAIDVTVNIPQERGQAGSGHLMVAVVDEPKMNR